MKKLFLVKHVLLLLLFLSSGTVIFAQDSTKAKVTKPLVKPVTKPVYTQPKPGYKQPGAAKYPPAGGYRAKSAVTTQVPATTPAGAVNPAQVNPYAPTPVSTDKSLNGQYQYVLSKTYHYQQPMIAALWKNINDSLSATKRTLKEVQAKLNTQNQSISSLQSDVKTKEQSITESNSRRDQISLLGIYMTKTAYNLLMWGLVIVFGLGLLIVILRTGGATREAKYRTKLYDEVSEEFQAYKVKANEKEKKLARELQTERNKVDELMGRG
jgi:hypothetical protein